MLTEVKNNLKFFLKAIKCSVMSAVEYRASFLVSSIFMFINNGFFLVVWYTIFKANGNSLNGVTFDTIMYLWAISTIGYGLPYFFFGGLKNINLFLISGAMDSYMVQPKSPLLNVLTSKCDFSAFGDFAYGIFMAIIVSKGNLLTFMYIFLFGCFASLFYLATSIIIRSLSVWIGDTDKIARTYSNSLMITFSIYPEQIFGGMLKVILYTVVPVGYMVYMPINIIAKFDPVALAIVIVAGIAFMALAVFVFNKALKRYESGNTISMRS